MNCPVTKFIDSKMQRFDPLWQAQNGVGGLRSRYYDNEPTLSTPLAPTTIPLGEMKIA